MRALRTAWVAVLGVLVSSASGCAPEVESIAGGTTGGAQSAQSSATASSSSSGALPEPLRGWIKPYQNDFGPHWQLFFGPHVDVPDACTAHHECADGPLFNIQMDAAAAGTTFGNADLVWFASAASAEGYCTYATASDAVMLSVLTNASAGDSVIEIALSGSGVAEADRTYRVVRCPDGTWP